MDDHAGAPPAAPASANPPPLMDFGDFMSLAGGPVPEATDSVSSAPRVSAGNAARVPAETTAAPTFVEAGAGRAPMPLRTPAEVVEAAARVSRREAEVSAREARAAERESALAMADVTARASRDARAANTIAVAAEADSAASAASDARAANLAVAANLDRRETAVRARERELDRILQRQVGALAERRDHGVRGVPEERHRRARKVVIGFVFFEVTPRVSDGFAQRRLERRRVQRRAVDDARRVQPAGFAFPLLFRRLETR